MGLIAGFVVGVIVGVIGAWWFFERRDAESRELMEAGWKKKLEHVEAEVKRADGAHEETKERLRLLQLDHAALQANKAAPAPAAADAATEDARLALPATQATLAPAGETDRASATTATPGEPSEAERRAQARRRIDAKLAQLPAGSSARQRLMAERAALSVAPAATTPEAVQAPSVAANQQRIFTPPDGPADDLELIRGIGPVLKERLNGLGITTFAQIAAFSDKDRAKVDDVLGFKGRIEREGWVEQARAFAKDE